MRPVTSTHEPDEPGQPTPSGPATPLPPETVDLLTDLLGRAPGRISCAVRLDDGRRFALDAERPESAASTIKVPLLLTALRACQQGRLTLVEPVPLPPVASRVGGGGAIILLPSLAALPLREVLTLMIALSDNDATNAVIDLVGFAAVAGLLAEVPTRRTRLQRTMMDRAAIARGENNETSAADLVEIVVALREGRLLDEEHTGIALDILRTQQFVEGLPAYLPEDITVASKTGSLFGLRGDVALFERSGRWAVVAVLASRLGAGEGSEAVDRGTAVLPVFAAVGESVAALL